MATARNGNPGWDTSRRFRLDGRPAAGGLGGRISGRRFVLASALVLAVLWGALALVFLDWKARHRELAAFGRSQVATTVDPLAELQPPGVPRAEWRRAVAETHAMIARVTAAGLLDRAGMEALRADLAARVVAARPETAEAVLSRLWDDMERKARFPMPLGWLGRQRVAATVDPLAGLQPPGVAPEDWRRALADTRALLASRVASGPSDPDGMEALRADVKRRVAAARAESAVAVLSRLWDDLGGKGGPGRIPRPKILGDRGPR